MDLALTDDRLAFQEVARDFVEAQIVPHRTEWDRRESVDTALIPRLGDLGFLGLGVPEEYGGVGGDFLTYCVGLEELGAGDSSVRGIVSVSLGLVAKTILAHGTQEQKERWLPGLCSGTTVGCFGLTEPDTGSDAGALRTKATREGEEYVLNGSKIFITNGTWADVAIIFARTGEAGPKGVSAFLVPCDTPGFQATVIKGKLGLRGQATAELSLENVRVPADALLGSEGQGFKIAMGTLDKGRISVAAGCVGIIRACYEAAVAYSTERKQFGRPIASYQLVQDMIAEMSVELDAARLLVWRAADLVDRGESFGVEASKAKYFASEAAVRSANRAIQVFGGYGYVDEYPVEKFLRDARVMTLYEGTSQIQKLLIGRAATGVNAFL
ncbi:alkylation response protein AidB-like acyl-CoA dehydrogenase [Kineosphaera limosa]|uniref:Acyl-CoA dehydrogenase n=1 Tax=Kineosphaera limosa NBRC 100340 TaxID=1184609 RepID=K6VK43_9MICO|nr:acyl-CoA dehydrogenase family protein [Kineosphaera limosa]NYE01200.1 alkylation response protein AidB-like acyl-CoA dehydrogenase [Kineosphaera limosa]GAB96598.1 acyl-CoA dehydrogenase [Kineosphaera limosa NBRC 100340]